MALRLTGWTRLWIVIALTIWAIGFWQLNRDMPPIAPDRAALCQQYGQSYDVAARTTVDHRRACMTNRFELILANERWQGHWNAWLRLAAGEIVFWLALPFLLGIGMFAIGWVRRGFRQE